MADALLYISFLSTALSTAVAVTAAVVAARFGARATELRAKIRDTALAVEVLDNALATLQKHHKQLRGVVYGQRGGRPPVDPEPEEGNDVDDLIAFQNAK